MQVGIDDEILGEIERQPMTAVFEQWLRRLDGLADRFCQRHRGTHELDRALRDARDVEQIIDEADKVMPQGAKSWLPDYLR